MKIVSSSANRRHEQGFMMVVLLVFLGLMLIYTAANIQTLSALNRDIQVVEQAQIQRLVHSPVAVQPVTTGQRVAKSERR